MFATKACQIKHTGRKNVGLDHIPNELYIVPGIHGQLVIAQLHHRSAQEGPPLAWRGGLMRAAPRTPLLLSPYNSRALLCVFA